TVERRRSPRTLESLSVGLGWEPGHLHAVLKGHVRHPGSGDHAAIDAVAISSRLDTLELKIDELAKLISGLRDDLATVVDRVLQ
ncbi:MAG: hypothetical protein ACRDN0_32560, partial [Trebonia sp.]